MSIDAEKWDNDIEYAYEKMIEREKEKEHNISNSSYECNCGKEVLNKGKEEHASKYLNHLYYRKGNVKGLMIGMYSEIIDHDNGYLKLHPENNKMHFTDYRRIGYTDFLTEQEEKKAPLDEDDLSYLYKYRDELYYCEQRINELPNLHTINNNMFRNKNKQSKIPLEKKLTKEPTKYDKQI